MKRFVVEPQPDQSWPPHLGKYSFPHRRKEAGATEPPNSEIIAIKDISQRSQTETIK